MVSELNRINNDTDNLKTTLSIRVGGNSSIKAAEIVNANGSSVIQSAGDLEIGSIQVSEINSGVANANNYNKQNFQQDIGSTIKGVGDIQLQGNNITIKGSSIASEQGTSLLLAENNIDIIEGRQRSESEYAYKVSSKSTFGSRTDQGHEYHLSDEAIASTIECKQVILDANNINIRGSNLVSDDLTQLQARENITIAAAENQYIDESVHSTKKSGLMSSGGIGFSVGSKKESTEQDNEDIIHSASTVGTVLGAAVAAAGGNDALMAGLVAGGSEAAAPKLAQYLYGKDAQDLTADEKSTISAIVGLAGSAVGASTGDVASTVQAGQVSQNAVENNEMSLPFPLDPKLGQGYETIARYAQENGLSEAETQKLIYEYRQKDLASQGDEYIQGLVFGSIEMTASAIIPEIAIKKLEPIVVVAKESGIWSKVTDTVKGLFGKGNPEEKVTVYRVDDTQFTPRINQDGEVPIFTTKNGKERALFLNFGDEARAQEFAILNRKGDATITAVDVDKKLLDKLRETAIYDKSEAAKLNPEAPIVVDINKASDQYGLRTPEQIQMFRDALDPKTVRPIPLDSKKVPKK